MRYKIVLSKTAVMDLEGIVGYYFELNKKTASRYYRQILTKIRKLASFLELGRLVPEFEEEFYDRYREIIYENLRIIYRTDKKNIYILRIIDGRRLLDLDLISVAK